MKIQIEDATLEAGETSVRSLQLDALDNLTAALKQLGEATIDFADDGWSIDKMPRTRLEAIADPLIRAQAACDALWYLAPTDEVASLEHD